MDLLHNQEVLWLLYFAILFNVELEIDNICMILKNGDNFSKIVILDYINFKKLTDNKIKDTLLQFFSNLNQEDENIYGKNWLLIYEVAYAHKYEKWEFLSKQYKEILDKINQYKIVNFYKKLQDKKVNFYMGIESLKR